MDAHGVRRAGRRARRLVRRAGRWIPRRPGVGRSADQPGSADHDAHARVTEALDTIGTIERREGALPSTRDAREFLVRGRMARHRASTAPHSFLVPADLRAHRDEPGTGSIAVPVAAETVVLAKFDMAQGVKFRALYPEQSLTLAAAPRDSRGTSRVLQAAQAHAVVERLAPTLIPELVAHGRAGRGIHYLVERWVDGVPLVRGQALAEAMPEILSGLSTVYEGYGVQRVPPSRLWGSQLASGWDDVWGWEVLREPVWRQVRDLLAQDRRLRVSWTHGDPVASNILRTPTGVTLVDWEHSREAPMMYDAAKLHLFTADPDAALDLILGTFGPAVGGPPSPDDLRPAEELALVHAHHLTRARHRRAALEYHPRARIYERQVRRQTERLQQALARIDQGA